jgi:CRISPR/Cas system-associated exonuclease Cas4 (RecB family)
MSVVKKAFNVYAAKKRRVFSKSRMKTIGASEIGQCIRKIGYLKHDMAEDSNRNPTPDRWGAARRGNTFEDHFFVPALRMEYGENIIYLGKEQKTWKYDLLSATPDGLLINQPRDSLADLMVPDIGPSGEVVIDCKTIDPRINLSEPKLEHVFQLQVQLGCMRRASTHKPDYGVLIYTNASFFDDVVEFVVKYDDKVFEHALKRASRILNAEHAIDLKPEGWIAGGRECEYCTFSRACKSIRAPSEEVKSTLDPQVFAYIKDLALKEKHWASISSDAEKEQRNIQEEIKKALRENNLRKINEGDMTITWSTVVGRPSFDMPKLKEAAKAVGLDVQKFERVGEPSDRLTINVSKKDRLVQTKKELLKDLG